MVVNKVIQNLSNLGFTEYEARTYIGLLPLGAATAYEISKNTGVPSSKIYEVLQKLVERDAVIILHEGGKTLYHAQDPDILIKFHRSEMNKRLDEASQSLDQVSKPKETSYVWNIRTYKELIQLAKSFILSAEKEILFSGFNEEIVALSGELVEAYEKTKRLAMVHFGKTNFDIGTRYHHPIEDTIAKEHGGRTLNIVIDRSTALTAIVQGETQVTGAWSKSTGFVILAEDYIKHDMYITRIAKDFDEELIRKYGSNYASLRDVFQKEEV